MRSRTSHGRSLVASPGWIVGSRTIIGWLSQSMWIEASDRGLLVCVGTTNSIESVNSVTVASQCKWWTIEIRVTYQRASRHLSTLWEQVNQRIWRELIQLEEISLSTVTPRTKCNVISERTVRDGCAKVCSSVWWVGVHCVSRNKVSHYRGLCSFLRW